MVQIGERRYVVAGHRMTREGEGMGIGYVVVPYPLGFVGAESLALVPSSEVSEVVAAGYANEANDAYLDGYAALALESADIPFEAYAHTATLLRGLAAEGMEQEEGGADA